jgi:hypothetical protein
MFMERWSMPLASQKVFYGINAIAGNSALPSLADIVASNCSAYKVHAFLVEPVNDLAQLGRFNNG